MTHHTDAEQLHQLLELVLTELDRKAIPVAYMQEIDRKGKAFIEQAARRDPAVQPMTLEQAAASMRATQAQPARIIAASGSCVPAAVEGATYREKWDAELGRTAMRFVDRAGDVHPGIDDADQICREFHEAMSAVINQMPHVQMMRAAAPENPAEGVPAATVANMPADPTEEMLEVLMAGEDRLRARHGDELTKKRAKERYQALLALAATQPADGAPAQEVQAAIDRFDAYFRSANGVPPNARVTVPTAEWQELRAMLSTHPTQQGMDAFRALYDSVVHSIDEGLLTGKALEAIILVPAVDFFESAKQTYTKEPQSELELNSARWKHVTNEAGTGMVSLVRFALNGSPCVLIGSEADSFVDAALAVQAKQGGAV